MAFIKCKGLRVGVRTFLGSQSSKDSPCMDILVPTMEFHDKSISSEVVQAPKLRMIREMDGVFL